MPEKLESELVLKDPGPQGPAYRRHAALETHARMNVSGPDRELCSASRYRRANIELIGERPNSVCKAHLDTPEHESGTIKISSEFLEEQVRDWSKVEEQQNGCKKTLQRRKLR